MMGYACQKIGFAPVRILMIIPLQVHGNSLTEMEVKFVMMVVVVMVVLHHYLIGLIVPYQIDRMEVEFVHCQDLERKRSNWAVLVAQIELDLVFDEVVNVI